MAFSCPLRQPLSPCPTTTTAATVWGSLLQPQLSPPWLTYRQVGNRKVKLIVFSLKFINQLHHWATEHEQQRQGKLTANHLDLSLNFEKYSNIKMGSPEETSSSSGDKPTYPGSRNSIAMLYSTGLTRPCKQRRFQPMRTPSKLPKMLSTSHGNMACSS